MEIKDLRIGMQVCDVSVNGRLSIPMTVVGIFSNLLDQNNATVYLDFNDNEGDVWEVDAKDLVPYEADTD